MQREISGTLSFDTLNNNVTLLLKSKGNSLIAQGIVTSLEKKSLCSLSLDYSYLGTYKRTDDETSIDIGLDSNGTKHLDASIGYARKKLRHGFSYFPRILLTINNERIVNLSGM